MNDLSTKRRRGGQTSSIDLYAYATPNGRKASIMLEETALPYNLHIVDIERGDQHSPEFRALNPNGESVSAIRLASIALVVGGIAGLKLSAG